MLSHKSMRQLTIIIVKQEAIGKKIIYWKFNVSARLFALMVIFTSLNCLIRLMNSRSLDMRPMRFKSYSAHRAFAKRCPHEHIHIDVMQQSRE